MCLFKFYLGLFIQEYDKDHMMADYDIIERGCLEMVKLCIFFFVFEQEREKELLESMLRRG